MDLEVDSLLKPMGQDLELETIEALGPIIRDIEMAHLEIDVATDTSLTTET